MSYKEYYKNKLDDSNKYSDFIMELFCKKGMFISVYCSKEYQNKGEGLTRTEIKFDDRMKETGNLYIELAEKSDPISGGDINGNYVDSGILRKDNTILWIQGDYKDIFLFTKKDLLKINKKRIESDIYKKRYPEVKIKTSKGFLMTKEDAKEYCIEYINNE